MTTAKTLLQLAGADLNPPRLGDAALVLIDIRTNISQAPSPGPTPGPRSRGQPRYPTASRSSRAAMR